MWFKSAITYRFSRAFAFSVEQLEKQLAEFAFTPAKEHSMSSFGWVPPLGPDCCILHVGQGNLLFTARREEKILPMSVIRREHKQEIEALELSEGRQLKKAEKNALKDKVMARLVPRAFSKYQDTSILFLTKQNMLVVDAASAKRAEEVLALLRKTVGSLPCVPLTLKEAPELVMNQWLVGGLPAGMGLSGKAWLSSALANGGQVRFANQDLGSDEITACLSADKLPTGLSIDWEQRVEFVLHADFRLTGLKFSDELREKNEEIPKEDELQRKDADFILMAGELELMIPGLVELMGGLESGE
ncbi:recombination-associated protein RdgC [Thaumasiovibrio sp. DFM-14]|uniref:recombination-associated protein RdgC n=1 Tax=Thaumasiovibrio sp. DFM-14 TaxID=3384792 RepID=UPI0039A202A8